jgi:hypothetical protein
LPTHKNLVELCKATCPLAPLADSRSRQGPGACPPSSTSTWRARCRALSARSHVPLLPPPAILSTANGESTAPRALALSKNCVAQAHPFRARLRSEGLTTEPETHCHASDPPTADRRDCTALRHPHGSKNTPSFRHKGNANFNLESHVTAISASRKTP